MFFRTCRQRGGTAISAITTKNDKYALNMTKTEKMTFDRYTSKYKNKSNESYNPKTEDQSSESSNLKTEDQDQSNESSNVLKAYPSTSTRATKTQTK